LYVEFHQLKGENDVLRTVAANQAEELRMLKTQVQLKNSQAMSGNPPEGSMVWPMYAHAPFMPMMMGPAMMPLLGAEPSMYTPTMGHL
jgi:hypothetical protein